MNDTSDGRLRLAIGMEKRMEVLATSPFADGKYDLYTIANILFDR